MCHASEEFIDKRTEAAAFGHALRTKIGRTFYLRSNEPDCRRHEGERTRQNLQRMPDNAHIYVHSRPLGRGSLNQFLKRPYPIADTGSLSRGDAHGPVQPNEIIVRKMQRNCGTMVFDLFEKGICQASRSGAVLHDAARVASDCLAIL